MEENKNFKAGYVSVAGFPNVGKSTLLNRLVDSKLAIISPRPQTTRGVVQGILTTDEAQVIFLDTAGIHRPKDKLGDFMVKAAKRTFEEADVIYLIMECRPPGPPEEELIKEVQQTGKTTFLILNKIDLVKKSQLLPLIEQYQAIVDFGEIVPVSALEGDNIDRLLTLTIDYLPESPPYYPEDVLSDQIERDFIAEFIREKVFLFTRDEIPYSTAVVVEEMKDRNGRASYIQAVIYVEKESQKGILIGSGGKMIKEIGAASRKEIERFMGHSVYLDLRVKVEKKWRDSSGALSKMGYKP